MAGLLQKLQENHLLVEAICFVVIAIAMIALLYRVVWPNFGNKSVAIGFMTAVGSLIILAYAIFVELKITTETTNAVTYIAFDAKKCLPSQYTVPPNSTGEISGLISGSITFHNHKQRFSPSEMGVQATELTLVNIAMALTGDYKDWKRSDIKTPDGITSLFRLSKDKLKSESLFEFSNIVQKLNLKTLDVDLSKTPAPFRDLYDGIYPSRTSLKHDRKSIRLDHPLFQLRVKIDPSNRFNLVNGSGSEGTGNQYYIMQMVVTVEVTKKAKMSGHRSENEYSVFLNTLSTLIYEKFHVPADKIPYSRNMI